MSRAPAGDVLEVKPRSDVLTVMLIIAFVFQLIALLVMMAKAGEIFLEGKGLFS